MKKRLQKLKEAGTKFDLTTVDGRFWTPVQVIDVDEDVVVLLDAFSYARTDAHTAIMPISRVALLHHKNS